MTTKELKKGDAGEQRQTAKGVARLWQIEIRPQPHTRDRMAAKVCGDASDARFASQLRIASRRGFLVQTHCRASDLRSAAERVLLDGVVEDYSAGPCGDPQFDLGPDGLPQSVYVLLKPGVTDPEAESAAQALRDEGVELSAVRTYRRYWVESISAEHLQEFCRRFLANESIEQIVIGSLHLKGVEMGGEYSLQLNHVPIRDADDDQLLRLNQEGQLSLSLAELRTIQGHFVQLQRDPTDVELETIAQTWSEHCSHKTLAGRIDYQDSNGERRFENMLRETIFAATRTIRESLKDRDWCVSVFRDNAGIVRFDDRFNLAFKVETHNRPTAIEPYGGANTGIGGVIRDILGTGLGARPICNTDVFCFAPPDLADDEVPAGALHPRRVMTGVVAGVRDYGNRMGIPTVNGAVLFDRRYVGNPLVFCGTVGMIPVTKSAKEPQAGDWIVTIGGRTGRDGIHGATFSSAELTEKSEQISGGAVQIGNAITEKMLADVLLQARDEGLYNAVTDCGAGGFSSAIGEMGESIGAEVWLDKAPLKYHGLSYTEIWISEAQERMILAVPAAHWPRLKQICDAESVEANVIGEYQPTGKLILKYGAEVVGELQMDFLHNGRPADRRQATFSPPPARSVDSEKLRSANFKQVLLDILANPNVASKHWIIRQYDHEVQGASVIKPLVGAHNDGPSDAAVLKPRFDSHRGVVVACGINPRYGEFDPYHMATSSIDEAVRNCVAVGANPDRIAILDNFCWGRTDRPETLGSLVRAAIGCHDLATALGTPFISGKDSLHNEFRYTDAGGTTRSIAIPGTLLISAIGQVDDVRHCVTMDLKEVGNRLYLIGATGNHLGGSFLNLVTAGGGGAVPVVDPVAARSTFVAMHQAILGGAVRSCHDLSEGGLAVAIAEMAFAGQRGIEVDIGNIDLANAGDCDAALHDIIRLFSESNSRFLVEVTPHSESRFLELLAGVPTCQIGTVTDSNHLIIRSGNRECLSGLLNEFKVAWQSTLDFT